MVKKASSPKLKTTIDCENTLNKPFLTRAYSNNVTVNNFNL